MSCLSPAELARAVTTGDVPAHAAECVACRRELEHQRATRDALRALAVPRAPSEQRRAIKAEALAAASRAVHRSRRLVGGAALAVAIAAAAVAFETARLEDSPPPLALDVASAEPLGPSVRIVASEPPTPVRRPPSHPSPVVSEPPGMPAALISFRDAWVALRAGDNRTAVALFDRATDPAVAEEATYWAAIAAERAGDRADAKRRFSEFIARFPSSPYVEQARRALDAR